MDRKLVLIFAVMFIIPFGLSGKADGIGKAKNVYPKKVDNTSSYEEPAVDGDHDVVKRSFQQPYPRKSDTPYRNPNSIPPSFVEKSRGNMNNNNPCRGAICGSPLMITPLLESGRVAEAVKMAEVPQNSTLSSVKSYSGFFTINGTIRGNMFFWFFPAMEETYSPIVVRLQGGPGQSALFDIFNGIGPFRLDDKLNILKNPHTLVRTANMLYFDNPVGTGFSFTNSKEDYPTSQEGVADHLYSALSQFLTLFPKHKDNHVYLSGEGYGAKYALSLAKKIYDLKADSLVNLKGIILGSPQLDSNVIFNLHQHLFEVGILDDPYFALINQHLNEAQRMATAKNFSGAMDIVEEIFESPYRIPVNKMYYIPQITGMSSQYNILDIEDPQGYNNFVSFVNQTGVRRALHVGNVVFQNGRQAYDALREDILKSSKGDLLSVLGQYNMLIYSGNFDKKTPASLSTEILENIDWKHREEFRNHNKMLWKLNPEDDVHFPDGYIHKTRHFTHIVVLGSGHLVATDKPEAVYDAMNRFIWGRAYDTLKHQI